jgi:hypothetical protein
MKTKIAVMSLLVLACVAFNATVITIIDPPVSAAVAVSQLEDSEVPAAAMRNYSQFKDLIQFGSWTCVFLFSVVLFGGSVVTEIKCLASTGERS